MTIRGRLVLPALLALAAGTYLSASANAADATGTWLRATGTSHIKITSCGSALCGKVSWLKDPVDPATGKPKTDNKNPDPAKRNNPLLGTSVVLNMVPSGTAGQWKGNVYKADEGRIYTGYLTIKGPDTLLLEGCVLGGIICKKETLTRVQ